MNQAEYLSYKRLKGKGWSDQDIAARWGWDSEQLRRKIKEYTSAAADRDNEMPERAKSGSRGDESR